MKNSLVIITLLTASVTAGTMLHAAEQSAAPFAHEEIFQKKITALQETMLVLTDERGFVLEAKGSQDWAEKLPAGQEANYNFLWAACNYIKAGVIGETSYPDKINGITLPVYSYDDTSHAEIFFTAATMLNAMTNVYPGSYLDIKSYQACMQICKAQTILDAQRKCRPKSSDEGKGLPPQ